MKRFAAMLAFGVALSSGAAFADTIQNGYGNTFVVTRGDGAQVRYQFNEDGTFHRHGAGRLGDGRYIHGSRRSALPDPAKRRSAAMHGDRGGQECRR